MVTRFVAIKCFIFLDKWKTWAPNRTKTRNSLNWEYTQKVVFPDVYKVPHQLNEPHLKKCSASNCLSLNLGLNFSVLWVYQQSRKMDCWYWVLSITKVLMLSHNFWCIIIPTLQRAQGTFSNTQYVSGKDRSQVIRISITNTFPVTHYFNIAP